MEALRKELENNIHWEETYNKMILKQGFSKEDKQLLWKLKEVYKKDIIEELMSGEYEWSTPRKVEIAKADSKKKRVVYIYNIKDRYILGVLYRAVSKYYSDRIHISCFSYKKGTSTSNAIQYIKENKTDELRYGVKVDIHAYFNSVSREKVTSMINELFQDGLKKTIEKLMLDDTVEYRGEKIQEWKALIPGCAFGSFFANICLSQCDEYFESKNKIYARYSDDIIVLEDSKEKLQEDLDIIMGYLNEYGLTMNPDKYTWFEPGDNVEYLGLKLCGNGNIDISDHARKKIKKQIHRWCRKGRMEIERDYKDFESVARKIIRQFNNKNFMCIVDNTSTFGWCSYSFNKITTIESLREIDLYFKDTLRAMKTGKHNKANYKAITEEEFKQLGWVSLVELYYLYKSDYDYFMEIAELHKHIGAI